MKPWERRFAEKLGIEVPPSRPVLAPLDPDSFLRWFHAFHGGKGRGPTWREWAMSLGMEPNEEARREAVKRAAYVRKWQRLGTYEARR